MTHYKACRTAKELAVLCGYNDTVFTQLFKKNFHGDTPYQWLQKQTSYEIEFKLKKSTLPIKQIMLDYHFKTFSHFTTYCKRNIGATPNEIRKKGEESRDTPSLETYSVSANDIWIYFKSFYTSIITNITKPNHNPPSIYGKLITYTPL